MYYTESNIMICADSAKVYSMIKDTCKWPQIFPPCKSVKILKQEGKRIELELTAVTRKKRVFMEVRKDF